MTARESASLTKPTFRHLLVPLDGSRLAEAVLPAVAELARRYGAKVTLLHVLERGAPSTIHGESHLADAQAATAYLQEVSQRLAEQGVPVDFHVHPNLERDVAGSIVGHAAELDNDLVVLATHGRGGLRDVIVGSIAEQVIGRGAAPVLLIRPGLTAPGQPFGIHKVLVPLDGTPDSERALPIAEIIARGWEAQVVLLRVVPTTQSLPGEQAAVASMLPSATRVALDMEQEAAADYVKRLAAQLAGEGIAASAAVLRGDPTATVLEAARREGVDLVVMATHGRAGLDAFWSGSVGHRLAERLSVPILIVRSNRPRQAGAGARSTG